MSELQRLAESCFRRKDFQAALRHLEAARTHGELDGPGITLLTKLFLLMGRWREGWGYLAECCRSEVFVSSPYSAPRWEGQSSPKGKRFVVWGNGGLGDEIFYVRYLPRLADLGAEIYLDCPPSLVDLFRAVRGVHAIGAHPKVDYQLTTTELPMLFGAADGHCWPEAGPYLHAHRAQLDPAGLRVGLVWAAEHRHSDGAERTASLADMACLSDLPNVQLYSLQVGPHAGQTETTRIGVQRVLSETPTFLETAGFVRALDLVITVDTSVANLAGALGAKVWVAVPEIPNWRWGLTGERTIWYPSARVYRQTIAGEWASVFTQMARDLASQDRT